MQAWLWPPNQTGDNMSEKGKRKAASEIDSLFDDATKRKQNAAAEERKQRKEDAASRKRSKISEASAASAEANSDDSEDEAPASSRSAPLPGEYRGTGGKFELSKEPKPKVRS